MKSALLWFMLCLAAWGAVVPDASIVQPEDGAPRLPTTADPAVKHTSAPGQVPPQNQPTPSPGSSTQNPAAAGEQQPQVAVPTSGGAFADHSSTDPASTGESRPLEPLSPAPVSTGSAKPLWAALAVFLFLAIGGFWLAQRRDQE